MKDINNEKNNMKNLHFTTVKHCFFSNSMILIDVLSGNLLPLPYIYIYIICTCSYLSFSLSLSRYISSKRDNKHDESTDVSNIQIRNMVLKINRHVLLSQGFKDPQISFGVAEILRPCCWGLRRAARFSSHGFANGWKWFVCTDAKF